MATESQHRRLILALSALLLAQIVGAAVWYRWFRHEVQDSSAVIPRMQELTRERRYDEAVRTGQNSLHNNPGDDAVLQQIALVYLRRAQIETGDKAQFTTPAVENSEKALAVNPANQINFYATARVLDIAGDYVADARCQHYRRSAWLFEKRVAFLTGEFIEVEGRNVATLGLRQENDYLLQRVKGKMAKAGCQ